MPELPEVEVFCKDLSHEYQGEIIENLHFYRSNLRFPFDKKSLNSIFFKGTRILEITRRFKQLIVTTEKGRVEISLGMSGRFEKKSKDDPAGNHEHVRVVFRSGKAMSYFDPRRFGYWRPFIETPESVKIVDALSKELPGIFEAGDLNRKTPIKQLLMDQNIIGGVGNIYACEALFAAKVSPTRPSFEISKSEWNSVVKHLQRILHQAILDGGSTVHSFSRLSGKSGDFSRFHKVYAKQNTDCPRASCKGKIARCEIAGRGTFWCESCQI